MKCNICGNQRRFKGNYPPNDTEHWWCDHCQRMFKVYDQNYRDPDPPLERRTTTTQDSPVHPECDSSAPPGADQR